MTSYLKQYYLNDHKLRQRALLEFHRALKTGRMVAFTGAMTTEAFGYGSWKDLENKVVEEVRKEIVENIRKGIDDDSAEKYLKTVDMIDELFKSGDIRDSRVGFSILAEATDQADGACVERVGAKIAEFFQNGNLPTNFQRRKRDAFNEKYNVPYALFQVAGIRRMATLNYDLELERIAMFPGEAKKKPQEWGSVIDLLKAANDRGDSDLRWEEGSGRIRRVLAGGIAIESDVLNRERVDRMIEFSVGTDDVEAHIMHLHGRVDNHESMAISYRDYDKLYRRDDLHKAPFEFAKRILIGGNPILFIGLGMTETEVNRELEDFISNRPYNRVAPTFLLWNGKGFGMTDIQMRMKRLDMLHRLGVFTIFDSDLDNDPSREIFKPKCAAEPPRTLKPLFETKKKSPTLTIDKVVELENLRSFFPALLTEASNTAQREEHVGEHWRSMASRIAPQGRPPVTTIWQTIKPDVKLPASLSSIIEARTAQAVKEICSLAARVDMVCVIGASGVGKGSIARLTAESLQIPGIPLDSRLLVNGSYCFDTDSMLDGVARFFARQRNAQIFGEDKAKPYVGPPNMSRSQFFGADGTLSRGGARPVKQDLVVLNGMERFFGIRGQPLSAELEELLRLASVSASAGKVKNKVKWIFFGTERVHAFMRDELKANIIDLAELSEFKKLHEGDIINVHMENVLNLFRSKIEKRDKIKIDNVAHTRSVDYKNAKKSYISLSSSKISGSNQAVRQKFYSYMLSIDVMGRSEIFGEDIKLAMVILRTLAFIGMPTEAGVLNHCPHVVEAATGHATRKGNNEERAETVVRKIQKTLAKLWRFGLVMKMDPFPAYENTGDDHVRYVLHRTLLAELRFRFGIPLSEAKLSTAFNMSLYVAQPVDGSIPEPEIHDELGRLIDKLLGSYRDRRAGHRSVADVAKSASLSENVLGEILDGAQTACRACKDEECKSSDENLLRIYRLASPGYAQCLRTALAVIRGYYSTASILSLDTNDRLIREDRDGILLEHAERLDRLIDAYGKATLAREAMREKLTAEAFKILCGNAEPFYADEMVWLHNERGVVRLTMGDLYEARASFERALDINRRYVEINDRAHNWRRIRLNQLTVDIEGGDLGLAERKIAEILDVTTHREPRQAFREDKLVSAIAKGYRGWCWHLRGQREKARVDYDAALRVFSKLDEARAQAYFARLRVNVRDPKDDPEVRLKEVERAMAFAQSSRQLDVVYRILLIIADEYLFGVGTTDVRRREANRILNDTIGYSLQTDTHRVRCEAAISIARARFQTGDYEGAFRNAADAMTVATRYGLELRKITIRAVIAQIMAARGHPVTAEHLVRTSIKAASRIGFETAIDLAERVAREIPQVSSVTGSIDTSAKKQF